MSGMATEKTAEEFQQEISELFAANGMTPWDLYCSEDKEGLVRKIQLLIPDLEHTNTTDYREILKENAKLATKRDAIITAVWNQRKFNGGNILMSIIYVVYTEYVEPERTAINKTQFSVSPLFRIRKCLKDKQSDNCCMIFIDDNGRVYPNWKDYLKNNTLPEGIIVVPFKGCYDVNCNDKVHLQCVATPASAFLPKAIDVANTTAGVVGLGAAGVTIAALALPIAAPVLVGGAAVAGIASGIWSASASIYRLIDRGTHEECINITNAQARADWLGVAGGVVGLGASGATSALAKYATTGRNVSMIAKGTVNGLNIAAIAINGASVGNSALHMIMKFINDEGISSMDVIQLGASLFLVTHSVYNFRTASQIVNSSRNEAIQSARSQLSNRQRKAFDRLYKETVRLQGETQGKVDVIRALDNMPDSKQPLNDVFKITKQLNQNNLKASLTPDGKILLNNDLTVEAGALRQNLQHGIGENLAQKVGPTPTSYKADNIRMTNSLSQQSNKIASKEISECIKFSIFIGIKARQAIGSAESFEQCINNILNYVLKEELPKLISIAQEFFSKFVDEIEEALKQFLPFEICLWKVFTVIWEQCGGKDISNFIHNLTAERITEIWNKIREYFMGTRPRSGTRTKCSECWGYYEICSI